MNVCPMGQHFAIQRCLAVTVAIPQEAISASVQRDFISLKMSTYAKVGQLIDYVPILMEHEVLQSITYHIRTVSESWYNTDSHCRDDVDRPIGYYIKSGNKRSL